MRLIDADKIVEVAVHAYNEWNKAMAAAEGHEINRCFKMQELCKTVKAVADDCPTSDPESMRPTGRWELHGNDDDTESSYWCSNCNAHYAEDMFYPDGYVNGHWKEKPFSYCPHCGARMVNSDEKHCT